jgi:hypothetical protein
LGTSHQTLLIPEKMERFTQAMRQGVWQAGKEEKPVRVVDGRLRNGNHRVAAVIKAGIPVCLLVERINATD